MSLDAFTIIRSLVRRHMRDTGAFTPAESTMHAPVVVNLDLGEELIGWYRNPPPWEQEFVLFTTDAIICADTMGTVRIPISRIVDYDTPTKEPAPTQLWVRTRDETYRIRIAGSHGPQNRFKDIFSLTMLIQALIALSK